MTDYPISFTEVMVRAIRNGAKIETRRPAGRLGKARPGDRLWIREPFHLSAMLDGIAPLQAVARGYHVVLFAADGPPDQHPSAPLLMVIGKRRHAREMPKACHRAHLVVRHVRREPLWSIDEIGAQAEGVATRAAYAALWDNIHPGGKTIGGAAVRWADNPIVDVIGFSFVDAPIGDAAIQTQPQQELVR